MIQSRRDFLTTAAIVVGSTTFLPFGAHGGNHPGDVIKSNGFEVVVHPVRHASFVLEMNKETIYCDPVGEISSYSKFPRPDLVLVTHHHGDHFNVDTLNGLVESGTKLIVNPTVFDRLPDDLKSKSTSMANGENTVLNNLRVDAIGAYNLNEDRLKFHPKGRDNGYVLSVDGFRIYISGDTEDTPEMRALKDIDLAFVCMNLPFTMDVGAAASAVSEFKPKYVYPYHYRGKDGGTQDPKEFARLVGDLAKVQSADWYG